MAAKKTKALAVRPTVIKTSSPRPIVVRETKVIQQKAKKGGHRKSSNGGGGGKSSTMNAMIGAGGLALLEKSNMANMLPVLPVGGRAATAGLLLWFLGGKWRVYAAGPLAIATYNALGGMGQGAAVSGFGIPGVAAVMP